MSEFPSGGMYIVPSKANSFILEGIYFPRTGLFKNATFRFNFHLKNFPQQIPILQLKSSVIHPLVSEDTNTFDFSAAFSGWSESNHLYELLQYFKFTFENLDYACGLSNPVNMSAVQTYNNDRESFINECKNCVTKTMNEIYNSEQDDEESQFFFSFDKSIIDDNIHEKIIENMKNFNDLSSNDFPFTFERRG